MNKMTGPFWHTCLVNIELFSPYPSLAHTIQRLTIDVDIPGPPEGILCAHRGFDPSELVVLALKRQKFLQALIYIYI